MDPEVPTSQPTPAPVESAPDHKSEETYTKGEQSGPSTTEVSRVESSDDRLDVLEKAIQSLTERFLSTSMQADVSAVSNASDPYLPCEPAFRRVLGLGRRPEPLTAASLAEFCAHIDGNVAFPG